MKKVAAFILASVFFLNISFAQPHNLYVNGESGKLYLMHTVIAKENWYSVGRIYNLSPKELASFNGLTMEMPLKIGQALKIPLTNNNFSQDGKKNADETFVPVFHTVQTNEMLSGISAAHNKVPVENLQKWNKIKKDGLKDGMQITVGFLKVKSSLSYLAAGGTTNFDASVATNNSAAEKPVAKPIIAQEEKKTVPVAEKPQPIAKQTKSPNAAPNPVAENKPVFTSISNNNVHLNGGYFAADYNDGNNKIAGLAGTFKSTSGWNDGKYYVLVNNIQVGTIVKIIAPATQKSVFAKVLGQLPEMKESEGLIARISNAAAIELGESEGKFNVQVKY